VVKKKSQLLHLPPLLLLHQQLLHLRPQRLKLLLQQLQPLQLLLLCQHPLLSLPRSNHSSPIKKPPSGGFFSGEE
jgi:hypothetical protein